jgi:hypothetical protein
MTDRYARFHIRVYARNRRPETGEPVAVIAQTRREAVSRAIDLGWNGHRDDARVYVDRIEDIDPRECSHLTNGGEA